MGLFQDVIFVEDEGFRVKNTVYEVKDIEKFLKKAKKKRKIIIYNESIYNKEISFKDIKEITEKNINEKIIEEFGEENTYLFNYEKNLKNKVVNVYAIKGALTINSLCKDANSVEIIPVQLILKKLLQREIKNSSWNSLIKIEKYYYFISVEEGILRMALVERDCRALINKIPKDREIYFSKNIRLLKEELKDIEVKSMKGEINEKRIKKQKVYT